MKIGISLLFSLGLYTLLSTGASGQKFNGFYYQIKVYHLQNTTQEERVDKFLQSAYLPALHRAGIPNIGVFKPVSPDPADRLVYVFTPFKKFDNYLSLENTLKKDKQYQADSKEYMDAAYNNAPYTRLESILLQAFSSMPQPKVPTLTSPKKDRIYELRSYESATEKLSANKIEMFDKYEVAIFTKLNFNAIFYGRVISGSHMPNLMYMTTFNNKTDRDKHWSDFSPEYKPLSILPQYQNNVSKNNTSFLYPTDYSEY